MLDFIPQKRAKGFPPNGERDKVYTPNFKDEEALYKEFGMNNEIDLAMAKPQYKSIVDSHLGRVQGSQSPSIPDDVLMENAVSREFDINELREIAVNNAREYGNSKRG